MANTVHEEKTYVGSSSVWFGGIGSFLRRSLLIAAMSVMAMPASVFAETVQAALDRLYPGWTVSNFHSASSVNGNVIETHPASGTVPATLTHVGPIGGTYPVLHLKVTSKSGFDWVLSMRINGQPVSSPSIIIKTSKEIKIPLAAWTKQGDVKIELDNAAGGTAGANPTWNNEFGIWQLIEIGEDESVYRNNSSSAVQAALDAKFPGWSIWGVFPGNVPVGANGDVIDTHPYDMGVPCFLSRTVEITGENPTLVVKVSSKDSIHDWLFCAQINGETVLPRQQICGQEAVEFRLPLARWVGQGPVEIRLFNCPGGPCDAWNTEYASWQQIEIVEGQTTGEPALFYSYLQGQGGQFINTGYFAKQTSVFDVKLFEPELGNKAFSSAVFGGGAYDDFGTVMFYDWVTNALTSAFGLAKSCYSGPVFPRETWVDLNVDVANRIASWTSAGQNDPVTIMAGGNALNSVFPVFIFDGSNGATGTKLDGMTAAAETSLMRLHSFSVREGSTAKLDLVPYRRADGLKGLMDVLTGTFYPNVGHGAFLVGGLGYTVDGTRLLAHEGEMMPFDIRPDYTAIEKVSAGELDVSQVAELPSFTVTEGTVAFLRAEAGPCHINGALTINGGTTLRFGVSSAGCCSVSADSLNLVGASAENPIHIELVLGKAIDFSRPLPLIVSGLTEDALSSFVLEGETPFALAIEDGALVFRSEDTSVPVVAVWTNDVGDGDYTNPGNWAATNGLGQAIAAVPTSFTLVRLPDGCAFNCTNGTSLAYREIVFPAFIGGDCDWRGFADLELSGTFDLAGHVLTLGSFNGTATITSGGDSETPTGEVRIDVPAGVVVTNATMALQGNLRLVKTGEGTFVSARAGQTYTGGTVVRAGVVKPDARAGATSFGPAGSRMTIESGAQYWDDCYAPAAMSGGVFQIAGTGPDGTGAIRTTVRGNDDNAEKAWAAGLELADDAEIARDAYAFALITANHDTFPLTLNGHTLTLTSDTLTEAPDWPFFLASSLCGTSGDTGTIVIGDNIHFYPYMEKAGNLSNYTLVVTANAIYSSRTDVKGRDMTVGNLVYRSESEISQTSRLTTVLDSYTPSSTTSAPKVKLGDASHLATTLDLSERTTAIDVAFGGGLTFAEGSSVTVKLGNRRMQQMEPLVVWSQKPSASFKLKGRPGSVFATNDGLYFCSGLTIIVR